MDSEAKIETLKQGLRIKYRGNLNGLKKLFEEVFAGATRFVEITGTSFEGSSAQGVHIFERLEYLRAVQDILGEMDPDNTPKAPPAGAFADLSYGCLQT